MKTFTSEVLSTILYIVGGLLLVFPHLDDAVLYASMLHLAGLLLAVVYDIAIPHTAPFFNFSQVVAISYRLRFLIHTISKDIRTGLANNIRDSVAGRSNA